MSDPEEVLGPGAGLSVWRDAPSFGGRRTAALGRFACETAQAGARLIRASVERLRPEGFEAVVGPMDGDTWGAHRLVVESDGRPPFLLEPHHPPHHPAAFQAAGLEVIAHYTSAEASLEDPAPPRLLDGVRLRAFQANRPEDDLLRIHELSLRAFAGNFLYRPTSPEAFLELYRPVLPRVDPELVLLAEDEAGDLLGFLFGLPDALDPDGETAILKTYASLKPGVGSLLASGFKARAAARGHRRVVHALMHESNLSLMHSRRVGGRVFRRYALWGATL